MRRRTLAVATLSRIRALSLRRNFISRFRYMFCQRSKEFLLDRGFRVRSKVRNGETANGPSGMICALHTQELQNRRGKTPARACRLPAFSLGTRYRVFATILEERYLRKRNVAEKRPRRASSSTKVNPGAKNATEFFSFFKHRFAAKFRAIRQAKFPVSRWSRYRAGDFAQ